MRNLILASAYILSKRVLRELMTIRERIGKCKAHSIRELLVDRFPVLDRNSRVVFSVDHESGNRDERSLGRQKIIILH